MYSKSLQQCLKKPQNSSCRTSFCLKSARILPLSSTRIECANYMIRLGCSPCIQRRTFAYAPGGLEANVNFAFRGYRTRR